MSDWILLNHQIQTPPSKEIAQQIMRDSLNHWMMGSTEPLIEEILDFLGVKGSTFWLTKGSAENHFQVLFSHYIDFVRETGRTHIVSLETEQNSILEGINRLEIFEVQGKKLPVNRKGQLTKSELEKAIRPRSGLLSISLANPFTGIIQPIQDLIQVCHENGMRIHVDITYAIGKLYLFLDQIDFLTFDGKLLHCPGQIGGLVVKKGETFVPCGMEDRPFDYAYVSALKTALEQAQDKIDHYTMEVRRLRDLFELKMKELGATLFFQEVERLPNSSVIAFEGIHGDYLLHQLKRQGVFATIGEGKLGSILKSCQINPLLAYSAVSFCLSDETTQEEILRAVSIIQKEIEKFRNQQNISFTEERAKAKNMRLCSGIVDHVEAGKRLTLSLLVDEEDGVIADTQFTVFGPPALHEAAEIACTLLLRKNYMQAKRLSADLIENKMSFSEKEKVGLLNLVMEAIEIATEKCMDIPFEDIFSAPPEMGKGEREIYPNWENLTDAQKKGIIAEVIDRDIRPYVELDAGGVEVLHVKENRVTIAYSGNCTSCFSATGATLDAIGNLLRHKIYPDLMVVPDSSVFSPQHE